MENHKIREILKKVGKIEVLSRRAVDSAVVGRYHSMFRGQGMHFDEVREYTPGDDARRIDWNVTARTSRPYVKKFVEEREMTMLLVVDVSASGEFGSSGPSKREFWAEVAGVLAFSAFKNQDRVGLLLFSEKPELYLLPQKGQSHIFRMIREMLFYKPSGKKTNFVDTFHFIQRVLKRKSVVFFLSDFCFTGKFDKELEDFKSAMRGVALRHDCISLCMTDPLDQKLPPLGLLSLEDAETGACMEINTKNMGASFEKETLRRRQATQKTVRQVGGDWLELPLGMPYIPELMRFFKKRARSV